MGFFDSFSELVAAATPWSTVEAEAPEKTEEKDDAEVCLFCALGSIGGVQGCMRDCLQLGSMGVVEEALRLRRGEL
jgi:hypothetical protein